MATTPRKISRTEAGDRQRRAAATFHGARAFEIHGEQALAEDQRSHLLEIDGELVTRSSVVSVMRKRARDAVMLCDILTNYIAKQMQNGKGIDEIPATHYLPSYMNTAQRSLKDLYAVLPDDTQMIDAEMQRIQEVLDE